MRPRQRATKSPIPNPLTAKASRKPDLLNAPVGRTLVDLTVPMVFALLALIGFNLADTFFVGLLGTEELAALGFTIPVTTFVTYMGIGLGIGTSALVARAIGSGDHDQAARITTDSLLLALAVVFVVMLAGMASITPVFRALGAPDALIPVIREFMVIWYVGSVFMLPPMVGNSALRALGDTRTASRLMLVAACLNGILDPLMIFGLGPVPGLGFRGAAVATVTAWVLVACLALPILYRRERLIDLHWPGVADLLASWRRHLRISAPAAAANMMTPVGAGIITALVAGFGAEAVAAYGVAGRIETLAMLVVLAMSTSLPPFLSQNFGAGRRERVAAAVRLALRFVLVLELAVYVLVALGAPFIAALFTRDTVVREGITTILYILPASYAFQSMVVLSNSSFNALHAPRNAVVLSIMRWFVCYVPLAVLGAQLYGFVGLFAGAAIGNVLSGSVAAGWVLRYTGRLAAGGRQDARVVTSGS